MNKLHYAFIAKQDLKDIEKYISIELLSPVSAKNIVKNITKKIRDLERFAELGVILSSKINYKTDYRLLVCGSYNVFYRVVGKDIYIDRILYGRRDYVSVLFGNEEYGSDEDENGDAD